MSTEQCDYKKKYEELIDKYNCLVDESNLKILKLICKCDDYWTFFITSIIANIGLLIAFIAKSIGVV